MFIPLHDANHLRHIHLQYVTLFIIGVNCLIWLFVGSTLVGSEQAAKAAVYSFGYIPAVANGYVAFPAGYEHLPQYATYLSYAFMHSDFMHLAGNMLFIWVFGDNVEDAMGHVRFIVFYVLCAVAAAVTHGMLMPQSTSPLIGASGAAAGIICAYLLLHPRVKIWILALGRIPLRLSALWVIGAWIIFQLVNLVYPNGESVSWGSHIGGMIAGAVLLPLFKRREVMLFDREPITEPIVPPIGNPPPEENQAQVEQHPPRKVHRWGRQPDSDHD